MFKSDWILEIWGEQYILIKYEYLNSFKNTNRY